MASMGRAATWGLKRRLALGAGVALAGTAAVVGTLESSVKASGVELHPPQLPWSHNGLFGQMDAFSIRRGWQVYKQVCSACHSLHTISYFEMVNVFLTEKEAKAEAGEVMVEDGPDDTGKMFMRPGRIGDRVPKPYPNDKAAAAANNGAKPPDLSVIALAREAGIDYIFWLLTSYQEPPGGIKLGPGQAYNPYFPGGVIGMAQQLYDEGIEYSDGTKATVSQQAKDVCTFLQWTADPHLDQRKRSGFQCGLLLAFFTLTWVPYWRALSQGKHTARVAFRVVAGREPHAKTDSVVPSVFDAAPAAPSQTLALNRPVSQKEILSTTAHLYKSYAPRYDWKESDFMARWRKWQWTHMNTHRQFGMLFDDMKNPDDDPVVYEAIERLPPWEKDARMRRDIRATLLSVSNEWLPKEEWTRYEDENWYLQPYIDQVEAEITERVMGDYRYLPNFIRRILTDQGLGKGMPKPE